MSPSKKETEELEAEIAQLKKDLIKADVALQNMEASKIEIESIVERHKVQADEATNRCERAYKEKIQAKSEAADLKALLQVTREKAYAAVNATIDQANERMKMIYDGCVLMYSGKLNDEEMKALKKFINEKKIKKIVIGSSST